VGGWVFYLIFLAAISTGSIPTHPQTYAPSYPNTHVPMKRITVRVQPNAKVSEIIGCAGGVWKIKLKSPAIEGRANEELIKFLAKKTGVAKSEIELVKGKTSRMKTVAMPDSTSMETLVSKTTQTSRP
jgi:uncharacterized protein (TIGR00251 family)